MQKIMLTSSSRKCDNPNAFLGYEGENQANKLVFEFTDGFKDGLGVLNLKREEEIGYVSLEKVGQTYEFPVRNAILSKTGVIKFQVVITGNDGSVIKYDPFEMFVKDAIDADSEMPEDYPNWVDMANSKLAEVDGAIAKTQEISNQLLQDKENGVFNGKDGVSPTVSTEQTSRGAKITITDANGTHTAEVFNGKDGADGKDGTMTFEELTEEQKATLKGEDGFSPIANVTQIDDGAIISVTDEKGTSTATVRNGKDGADGEDGLTPHIGTNGNWWIGDTDTGSSTTGAIQMIDRYNVPEIDAVYGGTTWTKTKVGSERLKGSCYGGGLYIIVGMSGTIITSQDGVAWVEQTSGVTNNLNGVCYGNGLYVIVGNGVILTSSDGVAWTQQTEGVGTTSLYGVLYADNQFVAAGYNGAILISTDGIKWTKYSAGSSLYPNSLKYINGQYLFCTSQGRFASSYDGMTWTINTIYIDGVPYSGSVNDIAYNDGVYVAVCQSITVVSNDLTNWSETTTGITTQLTNIISAGNQFVAAGVSGKVITSPDGLNWTPQTSNTSVEIDSLTSSDNLYVATGMSGTIITSSNEFRINSLNIALPLTSYEINKIVNIYAPVTATNVPLNINNLGEMLINGTIEKDKNYTLSFKGDSWDIVVNENAEGITELPIATGDTLGGIKVGEGLEITEDGVLNAKNGDSAPVGNIISFMGTIAPNGYLVCDGAVLNIADYPRLASHFETQFGSKNHFGGDGSTTFAVPDLRNEFLRGFGDRTNGIGIHQDATAIPYFNMTSANMYIRKDSGIADMGILNIDDTLPLVSTNKSRKITQSESDTGMAYAYITTRPTNVAVLYCIKY